MVTAGRAAALGAVVLFGCSGSNATSDPGIFIHCTSVAQCPQTLPMCDPQSQLCVGCLDNMQTCGPNKMCDRSTHTCVPANANLPCVRNADCPRPGRDPRENVVCQLDAGVCVGCVGDLDCVAPDVCIPQTKQCGDGCIQCTLADQGCDRPNRRCFNLDGGTDDATTDAS
jgi:hypothetical protein